MQASVSAAINKFVKRWPILFLVPAALGILTLMGYILKSGINESDNGTNRGIIESDNGTNRGIIESDNGTNLSSTIEVEASHYEIGSMPALSAFAKRAELSQGEPLSLAVHTEIPLDLDIIILRITKEGSSEILSSPIRVGPQPSPTIEELDGHQYTSFATWTYNVIVNIPDDGSWPGGYYEARIIAKQIDDPDVGIPKAAIVPFVILENVESNDSQLCVVTSYITPNVAYNTVGGANLYMGLRGGAFTREAKTSAVSVQRPVESNSYQPNVRTVVSFLYDSGYTIRHLTDLTIHRSPTLLSGCKVVVAFYHFEYVSSNIWVALSDAVDRGVHLTSLSANSLYWKVEIKKDKFGHDIVIVDRNDTNNLWRHQSDPNGRSFNEQEIFGAQYTIGTWSDSTTDFLVEPRSLDHPIPSPELMDHWIFEETGLKFGDKLSGLMGLEVDTLHEDIEVPDMIDQIYFISPFLRNNDTVVLAYTTYFKRTNGQMTFHSGTLQFHNALLGDSKVELGLQKMIQNILERMVDEGIED